MKRIILTGGGTGGHITPLIAVAHQLKKRDPNCYIIYIGERNGKYATLLADNPDINETRSIFAGKFRRYHKESWLRRIFAIRTNLLNLRDLLFFVIGTLQSLILIKQLKPDVILLKGGFVGVPVGLSAAFWRLSFITHDSDALPGLANRLVSKWAKYHATGMPPEYYRYPKESIKFVGVLVGPQYEEVTEVIRLEYLKQLNLPVGARVLTVTGGSGGAAVINKAVRREVEKWLDKYENLYIFHQVGVGKGGVYDGFEHPRLSVLELLSPMHVITGVADLIITRAGANTMAELGIQHKACIVIPNPLLTGGHQLKNAELWEKESASVVIQENELTSDPNLLTRHVDSLLNSQTKREELGSNLASLTVKDAASSLAELLLESAKEHDRT